MQYSGHASAQDCVSEIRALCSATSNTYPINDITRRFNAALDRYFEIAHESDQGWPVEDLNQSDVAILPTNLTSGTNKYKISSITGTALNILKVGILDDNASPHLLTPEKFEEVDFDISYATTSVGTPSYYTLYGDYLYVRPTPNYTEANGLRIFADRAPLYMSVTDTTKIPGVAPKYEHYMFLCRFTALPYLIKNLPKEAAAVAQQIQQDEREIARFFSRRQKNTPRRITSFYSDPNNSNR